MPPKIPAAAVRLAFKVRNIKFKSGVPSVKDADRSGHPSKKKAYNKVCQVKEFILDNRKPLHLKLLTFWDCHSNQHRAYRKQNGPASDCNQICVLSDK